MARFSNIVLAYLIIGSVMWGGGAVAWGQTGVNQFFIEQDQGHYQATDNANDEFGGVDDIVKNVISQFGGPIIIVWNLVSSIISWVNWPISILLAVGAPPRVVVGIGVPFTAAFYLSFIRVVRSST